MIKRILKQIAPLAALAMGAALSSCGSVDMTINGEEGVPLADFDTAGASPSELVVATNATVDGQTTAHYIADRLEEIGIAVSGLAHGVPVGGELDYLDDGTISAALKARGPI